MAERIETQLSELTSHRISELAFAKEHVHPYYQGRSILNIPSSISKLLGAGSFGTSPLAADWLAGHDESIRRVIFILMDALSLARMRQWMNAGRIPVWEKLAEIGTFSALTSISPSTTCAALTSLWTGRPPAWHGISGYEMWLKEYGVVANMIEHRPMAFDSPAGSLSQAGFDPLNFLPEKNGEAQTLGTHLARQGVQTHVFQHYSIAHSGLSRMFMHDAIIHPISTAANLWVNVRQLVESESKAKQYIWVYWGDVDGLSHFYGPDDERPAAEFTSFSADFERYFFEALSAAARAGTYIILGADHGQIHTRKDPHYDLSNHRSLIRRLHIMPTGENRLAYLYPRPGQSEAVREYIERTWPNQFSVVESEYALHKGLLGSGKHHADLRDRCGDLMLAARGDAYLWWGARENPLIGRHGGLSADEMLVPLLTASLG